MLFERQEIANEMQVDSSRLVVSLITFLASFFAAKIYGFLSEEKYVVSEKLLKSLWKWLCGWLICLKLLIAASKFLLLPF